MNILTFVILVYLFIKYRKKLIPYFQALFLIGLSWWGIHIVINLFYPVKPSFSFFILSIVSVIIGIIWGVKIWQDPKLSREEKWKRLNGKY